MCVFLLLRCKWNLRTALKSFFSSSFFSYQCLWALFLSSFLCISIMQISGSPTLIPRCLQLPAKLSQMLYPSHVHLFFILAFKGFISYNHVPYSIFHTFFFSSKQCFCCSLFQTHLGVPVTLAFHHDVVFPLHLLIQMQPFLQVSHPLPD